MPPRPLWVDPRPTPPRPAPRSVFRFRSSMRARRPAWRAWPEALSYSGNQMIVSSVACGQVGLAAVCGGEVPITRPTAVHRGAAPAAPSAHRNSMLPAMLQPAAAHGLVGDVEAHGASWSRATNMQSPSQD